MFFVKEGFELETWNFRHSVYEYLEPVYLISATTGSMAPHYNSILPYFFKAKANFLLHSSLILSFLIQIDKKSEL